MLPKSSKLAQEPENTCGASLKVRDFVVDDVTGKVCRGNSEADNTKLTSGLKTWEGRPTPSASLGRCNVYGGSPKGPSLEVPEDDADDWVKAGGAAEGNKRDSGR